MRIEDFTSLTAELRGLGGQRVWSLMISLFGDLARDPGQSIDGPLLSAIMGHLQVKPEAARVALHRLRNDGWIVSQKSGRISQHSLTEKGRAECADASPRIYAKPSLQSSDWQLVLTQNATNGQIEDMKQLGFSALVDRVFVGPVGATPPQDTLSLLASHAPDWLRQEIAPLAQTESCRALLLTLNTLQRSLPKQGGLSAIEIAVLRCLIVHNWRRIILKQPMLPGALIDPDGPSHQCHVSVANLLETLQRPKLSEIEQDSAAA